MGTPSKIHIKDYSLTDLVDDFSSAGLKQSLVKKLVDSKSGKLSLEVLLKGRIKETERFVKRLITPVRICRLIRRLLYFVICCGKSEAMVGGKAKLV